MNSPDPVARNSGLRQIALASVFVAAIVLTCFQVTDLDLGGHVTVGREIVKTLRIPTTNLFSHTFPEHPYPVHQWLGQVILFGTNHVAGATGLILLRMAVVLLGAVLLYRNARREGAPVVVASGIVLLLLVAARPRFFERPFLVTIVLLPLLHSFVADMREGRTRRLWPIIPLITIWAHLHSGVLFGVLYLFASIVGEGIKIFLVKRNPRPMPPGSHRFPGSALDGWNYRRLVLFSLAAVGLAVGTTALLNPSGIAPLLLPFQFYGNANFRGMIQEYRQVKLGVDWPWEIVAGALALGIILRPRRVDLTQLLVVVGFGVLAYQAVREIITFAAAAAPLLGRTWGALAEDLFAVVARPREGGPDRSRRANSVEAALAVAVLAVAVAVSTRATRDWIFPFGFGRDPKHYPERAMDFLWAQNVRGPVFNTDVWASSLLLRGKGKRFPVFVDARLEAYPETFWPDIYYRVLQTGPGWEEVLDRYQVQCAILNRKPNDIDDRLGEALLSHPGWGLVYWNDHVMILLRREGSSARNQEILSEWRFSAVSPRRPQEVAALRGKDLDRAVGELMHLVSWEEDSFIPRWALASAWTRLGRGEEAADLFARLAKRRDTRNNAPFARSRAEAELVSGRVDAWAEFLRDADADPETPSERFAAAALLAAAGKPAESIEMYRDVLRRDPAHADAMNNLALLLARHGDVREARALVDEALRRSPQDPYYVASRAEILMLAGERTLAVEEFRRSLELLPATDKAAREEVMRWILQIE